MMESYDDNIIIMINICPTISGLECQQVQPWLRAGQAKSVSVLFVAWLGPPGSLRPSLAVNLIISLLSILLSRPGGCCDGH